MGKEKLPRSPTRRDIYSVGGKSGVTEIIAYDENGELVPVPWLAVYKGDFLFARIPARQVLEVGYVGTT